MLAHERAIAPREHRQNESECAMARNSKLTSGLLVAILGMTSAFGCNDDEDATDDTKGGSAGSEDKGGTAGGGSGGKAGSNTGGTGEDPVGGSDAVAGSDAVGGTDAVGGSDAAGGSDAVAGSGQGGEGGQPDAPPLAVTALSDEVYTQASDLRGLFYATDGKLYASGHLGTSPTTVDKKVVVGRFSADGVPDTTFGGDGFVELNVVPRVIDANDGVTVLNDGNEESLGIVKLAGGDIVVQVNIRDVNGKGMDVGLLRLDSTGAPVTTFGTNGLVRLTFGWPAADDASWPGPSVAPSDTAWGIELDPSSAATEKIVVFAFGAAAKGSTAGNPAVQRVDNDRYVARVLAADGSLDPAFNDGKVLGYNSGGTFSDGGRRGVVNADGSIVSAGYTDYGAGLGNHILVLRLTPAGKLDTNFGFGIVDKGVVRTNPFVNDGGLAECYNVAVQSSGRYVTTGYGRATAAGATSSYGYATTQEVDLISVGIAADGKALDLGWGNQATLAIQSEEAGLAATEDRGRDVLALPDDQLVYAGRYGVDPAIFVATKDGEFDPANGIGKLVTYAPLGGTPSHFFRLRLSKDGKRLAAATSNHAEGVILAVLKVGE